MTCAPPPEPPLNRDWSNLDAGFADALRLLFHRMEMEGYGVAMIEGFRTVARQNWLYGWGRTYGVMGEIRTARRGDARYGHCAGLAADCWQMLGNGKVVCPPPNAAFWSLYGSQAEKVGLVWGGRWGRLVDLAHVEMRH